MEPYLHPIPVTSPVDPAVQGIYLTVDETMKLTSFLDQVERERIILRDCVNVEWAAPK